MQYTLLTLHSEPFSCNYRNKPQKSQAKSKLTALCLARELILLLVGRGVTGCQTNSLSTKRNYLKWNSEKPP